MKITVEGKGQLDSNGALYGEVMMYHVSALVWLYYTVFLFFLEFLSGLRWEAGLFDAHFFFRAGNLCGPLIMDDVAPRRWYDTNWCIFIALCLFMYLYCASPVCSARLWLYSFPYVSGSSPFSTAFAIKCCECITWGTDCFSYHLGSFCIDFYRGVHKFPLKLSSSWNPKFHRIS